MAEPVNKNPLVSVITPFYNGGDWLHEAVRSVLAQTYTNWELILADDGSQEEASNIAKQYAADYPGKIIYAEHEGHRNKGVTASRNLAISKSKGDIIAFLDSDDHWLPGKLKSQVDLALLYPEAGMICEASEYWSSWENPSHKNIIIPVGAPAGKLYSPPELMYLLYPLGNGAAPCPSGMIMTRRALENTGGFEESFIGPNQVYEDQAFLCKIYLHEKVYISAEANNLYRQRAGSLMQSISQRRQYFKVRAYFLEWLQKYLGEKNIRDAKILGSLRMAKLETRNPGLYRLAKKIKAVFTS